MEFTKAIYSRSALQRCVNAIKGTNWTVSKKAEHFSKWIEVKSLFILCEQETKCCLFDWEYTDCKDYVRAIDSKMTKKELDLWLHRCYMYLCNEINAIRTLMETGEVDSEA